MLLFAWKKTMLTGRKILCEDNFDPSCSKNHLTAAAKIHHRVKQFRNFRKMKKHERAHPRNGPFLVFLLPWLSKVTKKLLGDKKNENTIYDGGVV